jgi:hypothetical protein
MLSNTRCESVEGRKGLGGRGPSYRESWGSATLKDRYNDFLVYSGRVGILFADNISMGNQGIQYCKEVEKFPWQYNGYAVGLAFQDGYGGQSWDLVGAWRWMSSAIEFMIKHGSDGLT